MKKEILEEVRADKSSEVTKGELQNLCDEIINEVQWNNRKMKEKLQSQKMSNAKRLKEQAFARRLNIIIFGIQDHNSTEDDRREVISFFENQMGLQGLEICATYRLGVLHPHAAHPRPLVIKFTNIKDRWAVWNNREKFLLIHTLLSEYRRIYPDNYEKMLGYYKGLLGWRVQNDRSMARSR